MSVRASGTNIRIWFGEGNQHGAPGMIRLDELVWSTWDMRQNCEIQLTPTSSRTEQCVFRMVAKNINQDSQRVKTLPHKHTHLCGISERCAGMNTRLSASTKVQYPAAGIPGSEGQQAARLILGETVKAQPRTSQLTVEVCCCGQASGVRGPAVALLTKVLTHLKIST
jgi:hypothetical protein